MPIETPYKSLQQLESELLEYGQAYAFGDIDKPEFERAEAAFKAQIFERLKAELCALNLQALGSDKYYAEKKRIQQAMGKVDTRPNCTFSAEPTGEPDPLAKAKRKATDELKARRKKGEVSGLNFARQIIDIATARTIEQVKEIATFKRPNQ